MHARQVVAGTIGRAVIDDDQLPRCASEPHQGGNAVPGEFELVPAGNDDRGELRTDAGHVIHNAFSTGLTIRRVWSRWGPNHNPMLRVPRPSASKSSGRHLQPRIRTNLTNGRAASWRSPREVVVIQPFPCSQRLRPSPYPRKVGDHIGLFEACSTFTGDYPTEADRLAESPKRHISLEGFDGFVTSAAAPIAAGWSDPVARRDLHPLETSTFTRRTQGLTPRSPRQPHGFSVLPGGSPITIRWFICSCVSTRHFESPQPRHTLLRYSRADQP